MTTHSCSTRKPRKKQSVNLLINGTERTSIWSSLQRRVTLLTLYTNRITQTCSELLTTVVCLWRQNETQRYSVQNIIVLGCILNCLSHIWSCYIFSHKPRSWQIIHWLKKGHHIMNRIEKGILKRRSIKSFCNEAHIWLNSCVSIFSITLYFYKVSISFLYVGITMILHFLKFYYWLQYTRQYSSINNCRFIDHV